MTLRLGCRIWGLLLALLPALCGAQLLLTQVTQRQTVSLSGAWNVIVDPYETGFYDYRRRAYDQQSPPPTAAFFSNHRAADRAELVEYDFDTSPTLRVPGDWNSQRESLLYYEGSVWYRRLFDRPAGQAGSRWFIHFGAVNQRADVYLNGSKLGRHDGGFTPFAFEVTALLRSQGNFLVVKVDNTRRADGVPTTSTDWWNYGGITREVLLVQEPAIFIQDHVVQLKPGSRSTVAGFVQLNGAGAGQAVSVRLPELGVEHRGVTDSEGRVRFEFEAPGLQRWSDTAPRLYRVEVATAQQTLGDEIGFRSIETRGADILLNGRPVFLRGISLHEENPLEGRRAHSAADALQLLTWARELGCNFVRLAHYPHNEHIVRLADRMGLLVWQEIPVYWTIDFGNAAVLANARQQLTEMIVRDRNRASTIIWSVANETPPSAERNRFLRDLVDLARGLDGTRLVSAALETHDEGGVSVVSDPAAQWMDIVSFNQYRGWYGGTLDDAPQARWDVRSGKPVVVSEFGGDALQGLHGSRSERWTEEYQAYLYQQNLAMLERIPTLRGLSPWILADFRSPRRVLPGIQDGYNRKGLVSDRGVRKQAFHTLRNHYQRLAAEQDGP